MVKLRAQPHLLTALLLLAVTVMPFMASADVDLFFPLQKNNVKILPQRFEYHLLSKDEIQIGDLKLDASQVDFQLIPADKSRTKYKIRFRWPSGFLKDGELVVKDSSGKAVMIKPINEQEILANKSQNRGDMAAFEMDEGASELLAALERYPFFKFCVNRQEPLTKMFLCSKDLYFKKQKGRTQVMTRDSFRPESFVEINGRVVGPQGIIFLNDPSEFVSLRTLLLSGATLELDTRVKTVEFKDVTLSDDEQKILIKATGAEPVDESLVQRSLNDSTEWQIQLDTTRPYVYLKGEGDLPLRQEFLIQGAVRKERTRVTILTDGPDDIPKTTYDETLALKIKGNDGAVLQPADRLSKIEPHEDSSQTWTLNTLKKNELNRRYIKVTDQGQTYLAGYDIFRASSNNAYLRLMLPLWAQLGYEHWFTKRMALQLQYDQLMSKSSTDPDIKAFELRAKFRNPPGLLGQDPYFGVLAIARNQTIGTESIAALGAGLTAEIPSILFKSFFQWMTFEVTAPLFTLDSKYKLDSSYDFQLGFKHFTHDTLYYDIGARMSLAKLKAESDTGVTSEVKAQKEHIFIGMGWLF